MDNKKKNDTYKINKYRISERMVSIAAVILSSKNWAKVPMKKRSAIMREVASHGAGRPRTDAERCPCGNMTLVRAKQRANKDGRGWGHEPECTFYQERRTYITPPRTNKR